MDRYVLFEGEVWRLWAINHSGDKKLWRLSLVSSTGRIWNRWVPADKCTLLDPALNILFKEKQND